MRVESPGAVYHVTEDEELKTKWKNIRRGWSLGDQQIRKLLEKLVEAAASGSRRDVGQGWRTRDVEMEVARLRLSGQDDRVAEKYDG